MTRHPMTERRVLYDLPGTRSVEVTRDLGYAPGLAMEVYRPPNRPEPLGAVLFPTGFSDIGARARMGCAFKDMASATSWAELVAASGMAAVTYTTGSDPSGDAHAALDFVRRSGPSIGIDPSTIGLWACSGHGPNALSLLFGGSAWPMRCAVFCYAFLLDLDGATGVAEAAKAFGFANPVAGRTVGDLPRDVPILFVRAGKDEFLALNAGLDRLVARGLESNLPLTLVNHPDGRHAFDLWDESLASRRIIAQVLAFLGEHLTKGRGDSASGR